MEEIKILTREEVYKNYKNYLNKSDLVLIKHACNLLIKDPSKCISDANLKMRLEVIEQIEKE